MMQHNGKINLVLKRAVLQLYCSLYRKVNRLLLSPMKYTDVVSYFGTSYINRSIGGSGFVVFQNHERKQDSLIYSTNGFCLRRDSAGADT